MKKSLIIGLLLSSCMQFASAENRYPPLSDEAKEKVLLDLQEALDEYEADKEGVGKIWLNSPMTEYVDKETAKTSHKFSPYQVRINYFTEVEWPLLIRRQPHFHENKSKIFYESKCQEILEYYLGSDYEQHDAQVLSATGKGAVIRVTVESSEQLRPLLADPRILDVAHFGERIVISTDTL